MEFHATAFIPCILGTTIGWYIALSKGVGQHLFAFSDQCIALEHGTISDTNRLHGTVAQFMLGRIDYFTDGMTADDRAELGMVEVGSAAC